MKNKERKTFALAIISIIISIGALIVSSLSLFYENAETLNFSFRFPADNLPLKITDYDFGESGVIIQYPCNVTFSNNSNRTLSIINYDLKYYGEYPAISYTGIYGGIYHNGNPVTLPITLSSGESKTYTIYIGLLTQKDIYAYLKSIIGSDKVTFIEATKIVARKMNLDVFGGVVKYEDDNGVLIKWITPKEFFINLSVTTGKDKTFIFHIKSHITRGPT